MVEDNRLVQDKGKRQISGLIDQEDYEKYKGSGMKISGVFHLGLMYPGMDYENKLLRETIEKLQKCNKALEDTKRRYEDRVLELLEKKEKEAGSNGTD